MENLILWNRMGLIPGPTESDGAFTKRASIAVEGEDRRELKGAFAKIAEYFDVSPTWIPITYRNRGLAPWHGGVMDPKEGLQLRKAFKKKGRYLGLYSREEIVTHELAHAGRFAFDEPKFEEVFAYQMSTNRLRRWMGPMVERPWEAWAFIASILLPLLGDYTCLIARWWQGLYLLLPLKLFPGLLIGLGSWRRASRGRVLRELLSRLREVTGCLKKARAIAYRLSDDEIFRFAKMDAEKVRKALAKAEGIRFEMIRLAYLSE